MIVYVLKVYNNITYFLLVYSFSFALEKLYKVLWNKWSVFPTSYWYSIFDGLAVFCLCFLRNQHSSVREHFYRVLNILVTKDRRRKIGLESLCRACTFSWDVLLIWHATAALWKLSGQCLYMLIKHQMLTCNYFIQIKFSEFIILYNKHLLLCIFE